MSLTRDLARLHSDSDGNLILANNLTVDTNTLKVDAANNKVGIGTDTPADHLEIKTANPALKITDTANSNNNIRITQGTNSYITASNNFYMGVNGNSDVFNIIDDDVLVGKTAADGSTTGHELRSGSFAIHTRPSNPSLYARRMTDDGPVVIIQDQNGDVGKIGVDGGSMYAGGGDVGLGYYQVADAIVPVDAGSGALRNNAIDLGLTSARYKDVHVGNAVKTSSAQFNSGGTYTPDPFTDRNDNYWESYRTCLGFFAPGAGHPYLHIKTNLPDNTNKMVKFEWNGFTYSGTNTHTSVTFYTYHATNSPYNPIKHNWGNGDGIPNYYYSSDNYVVIVITASGSYTGGFLYVQSGRSHMYTGADVITASNSNATSGVY